MPEPGAYARSVVAVLVEELPAFEEDCRYLVIEQVALFHRRPWDHFELIVDSVISARWRLKPDLDRPGMVRMGNHTPNPSEAASEIQERVNARLGAL